MVLADSDLFGDDCIGELDNEPLWLNLVYWAAQPAFAGVADRDRLAGPPPTRSWARAQGRGRGAAPDPGARRLGRPRPRTTPAASPSSSRRSSNAARRPGAATSPTRRTTSTPCAPTCAPGSTPASPSPTSFARSRRSAPSATARDGIEHLVVFPMYKQNASRDTCFEALIVRVPWPDFVAELERSGYDNPKFVPVNFVDYTAGYDSECAVLFPETFSTAERPPSHFGGIFCDREAERFRRVCGRAAELLRLNLPPDAACLLTSPELSARRLHRLGPDPRPHAHARRSALRPVHDPPAQPLLDVLARGASLRPDRVRRGGEARARAASPSPATCSTRSSSTACSASRSPAAASATTTASAASSCSPSCTREGYLHWTDNRLTIDWERVADGVGALRERVQDLYHSGIDRSKLGAVDRRPRPRRRLRAARRRLALGEPSGATCPRSTSRRSSSTWSRTTSSRSASSTPS